ncbi:MAG: nuclear transport factor 2 family protein [bacterium]
MRLRPFFVIAAGFALGVGCGHDDTPPLAPIDHLTTSLGAAPDAPMPETVLQAYSAAFAAGDVETMRSLLSPDFVFEIDPYCAGRASCGASFPWHRDQEIGWLTRVIAKGPEREWSFYSDGPTPLPGHRWRMRAGMNLFCTDTLGYHSGCNGTVDVDFVPDGQGGLWIARMAARRWFRSDDGCGLVYFRCLN